MEGAREAGGSDPCEEDLLRAHLYRLLAGYLARPPSDAILSVAANLTGDESRLGKAIAGFAKIASGVDAGMVAREYHALFIGFKHGELMPYGSCYLTGEGAGKPLARLRAAMSGFGIERAPEVKEPEDHIASVCDIMAELITGDYGHSTGLEVQRDFFNDHVGNWAPRFFEDLEGAKSSVLYAAIGRIGRIFMEIEATAFAME